MKEALRISAILLVCLLPIAAFAQGQGPGNPLPRSLPRSWPWPGNWGWVDHGRVIRYIEVPPQQVAVSVYVPGPGSFPGEYEQQVLEIPGYVIAETTTGYIYPQRWSLEQVNSTGVYYWRVLPPLFTGTWR